MDKVTIHVNGWCKCTRMLCDQFSQTTSGGDQITGHILIPGVKRAYGKYNGNSHSAKCNSL